MTVLSNAAVAALAREAGLPENQIAMAVAVAKLESGLNPDAVGDKNRPSPGCSSVGLWQINSCPKWPRGGAEALHDPKFNAAKMVEIWSDGKDWHQWSTRGQAIILARTIDVTAGSPGGLQPAPGGPYTESPTAGAEGKPFDLTSADTWLRVATFIAGIGLIIAGIAILVGDTATDVVTNIGGSVKGLAGKVAK